MNLTRLINDVASRYGLDPALVEAIVEVESGGNPWAVRFESHLYEKWLLGRTLGTTDRTAYMQHASSWGLMQVLGATARGIRSFKWFTELCDPEVGLDIGCQVLVSLRKRYSVLEDVIAAYNSGTPSKIEGRYKNQSYVDRVLAIMTQLKPCKDCVVPLSAHYSASPKYRFSSGSSANLSGCHVDLQRLMQASLYHDECPEDFTILCGHRSKEEQEDCVRRGTSKVHWPNSKHNSFPSEAVDIAPWPLDWQNIERFKALGAHVQRLARELGISIRWGSSWGDYPHWELSE